MITPLDSQLLLQLKILQRLDKAEVDKKAEFVKSL